MIIDQEGGDLEDKWAAELKDCMELVERVSKRKYRTTLV